MKTLSILTAALFAAAAFTPAHAGDGCSKTCTATAAGERQGDVVATALAAGNFKTLATALQAAGLVDTLKGEGPFTVFAPTDEAFAKLPKEALAELLKPEKKRELVAVLTYHVVPGKVMAADVVKLRHATTVNGQRVDVRVVEGAVSVDGAKVVQTDIACSNGVIHVIDTVMLPSSLSLVETAQRAGTFGTLLAAAEAAGLAETLSNGGPFTVLAPSDEAFAKLPKGTVEDLLKPENKDKLAGILKLHVIQGRVWADQVAQATEVETLAGRKLTVDTKDGVTIGGARVSAADVEAKNGVIHVIDTVILPR